MADILSAQTSSVRAFSCSAGHMCLYGTEIKKKKKEEELIKAISEPYFLLKRTVQRRTFHICCKHTASLQCESERDARAYPFHGISYRSIDIQRAVIPKENYITFCCSNK